MNCNECCFEPSCRGCPHCNIKEIHCDNCEIDLDIYYCIDDKALCFECAIEYIEDNIKRFEEEYDVLETQQDIIDLLDTHFKTRF